VHEREPTARRHAGRHGQPPSSTRRGRDGTWPVRRKQQFEDRKRARCHTTPCCLVRLEQPAADSSDQANRASPPGPATTPVPGTAVQVGDIPAHGRGQETAPDQDSQAASGGPGWRGMAVSPYMVRLDHICYRSIYGPVQTIYGENNQLEGDP